jgi:K+-sensing histidine kinase KdpD
MGLTIARNIVIFHGGEIEVIKDRRRRGANIRIVLPRKRSRATMHTSALPIHGVSGRNQPARS